MSEKKPRKLKGQFKLKTPKTNPLQNIQKIEQLMIESGKYYDDKNYEEAIKYCDEIIKIDSNIKEVYSNRGALYKSLGKYDKAIDDYTKAIKLDPDFKEAYLNLVNIYYNRGNYYANLKEYVKAIDDYTKAIKLDPNYTSAYYNRGGAYTQLEEYDKAIINYTEAIKTDPTFANAYNNRGTLYDKSGRHGKAISDYTEVIKLDPDFREAYFNRALAYAILKDYDKALEDTTDGAIYQAYLLLIDLYKTKNIDKDQVINTIKNIINNQKNDKILDENKTEIYSLYSYVPFDKNTIDTIVHNYKYAGEIFKFNDPTDPTIRLIEDTKEMTEILKNIRIACFSTTPLNMLMYSHYTDKHKGICIEYDFTNFDEKNTTLLKIDYEKELKIDSENVQVVQVLMKSTDNTDKKISFLDPFSVKPKNREHKEEVKIDSRTSQITMRSNDGTNKDISFLDLFRTKHLNWEYENEYRVMTYGIDKIRRTIKAIYFGKDTSDADKELIAELTKNRSIKLYEVIVKKDNLFELDKREYNPKK